MVGERDMKLTLMIALFLLEAAVSQAVVTEELRLSQPEENHKDEKRGLDAKHDFPRKRSTFQSFVAIVPGIVYHDSAAKPTTHLQNIYTTPLPVLSKISDVLTGQGPSFHSAIASHLVSPVSAYTAKLPTKSLLPNYEVTASIPPEPKYSEKGTYQIQPERHLNGVIKNEQPNLQSSYQRLQPYIQQQIAHNVKPLYSQDNIQYHNIQILQPVNPEIVPPLHNSPLSPWSVQKSYQTSQQPVEYISQQLPIRPGIEYINNEHKSVQKELEPKQNAEQKPPQKPDQIIRNQGASSYTSFFLEHTISSQPQASTHVTQNQQKQLNPLPHQILHQPQQEQQPKPQHETQPMPQYRKNNVLKQPLTVHYLNYPLQSEIQHQRQHGQNHFLGQTQSILYPNYVSPQNQFQQSQQYRLQHTPVTSHTQAQNQVSRPLQHNEYQIQREPLPIKPSSSLYYHKKILINNPKQIPIYQNFVSDINKKQFRSEPVRSYKDLHNNYIVSSDSNQTYKESRNVPPPRQYTPSHLENFTFHNQMGLKPKQALSAKESANSTLSLIHSPSHIEPKFNYNQYDRSPGNLNIRVAPNIEFHGKYAHEIFKNLQIWT